VNLNIRGSWNSLGYGICTKNIIKALCKLDHFVAYFPIGQPQPETREEVILLNQVLRNQDRFDFCAPSINLWHQHSQAESIGNGKRCGFVIFELDAFTDREKHHSKSLNKIFVPSKWGKQIISNNDIKDIPCYVVPLGVDVEIFYPQKSASHNPTVFFNCGKLEVRKSIVEICDIFNKAFTVDDNVELWMAVSNPFLKEDEYQKWIAYYKNSPLGKKIRFVPHFNTQQELANIMQVIDCGLQISKAEGWDLEALEMMACGKQLITTNYSAHTEFCTKDNSLLVDIHDLEEAYDGIWFHGEGRWAHIGDREKEQCIEHMRAIHKKKQSGEDLFNKAGIETAKRFSWQNTAQKFVEALKDDNKML
jgi:glycosyltransferase involved in cell wall biosynthesis